MTWQDSPFFAVLRRDLLLLGRGRADAIVSLLFFVLVACLFPLGVGADASLLRALGPGVLWVAALLATLLSQHRLFAQDHADGRRHALGAGQDHGALDRNRSAFGDRGAPHGPAV